MELPLTRETCETILQKLKMQNWTSGKICTFSFLLIVLFFFFFEGKSKIFLKYYHAEQLTRLYSNLIHAIITIQSYVRMRMIRSRLRYQQYKHSTDLIIEELHRHMKFARVNDKSVSRIRFEFFFVL